MMLEIGLERVEQRVLELAGMTADILRRLLKRFNSNEFIVAARHGNLRVSPYFYNTEADIERLRTAL